MDTRWQSREQVEIVEKTLRKPYFFSKSTIILEDTYYGTISNRYFYISIRHHAVEYARFQKEAHIY